MLLIDGYANGSTEVVARARALGLAIVADIEWSVGDATDELLRLSDHLVLPYSFGQSHSGEDNPAAIIARLWSADRAAVVLTRGAEGCYLRQAGDSRLMAHSAASGAGGGYHRGRRLLSRRLCLCAGGGLHGTGKRGLCQCGRRDLCHRAWRARGAAGSGRVSGQTFRGRRPQPRAVRRGVRPCHACGCACERLRR